MYSIGFCSHISLTSVVVVVFSQAEAKDVFKELLASVKCASEWTWEQAMRVIVNDPRWVRPSASSLYLCVCSASCWIISYERYSGMSPELAARVRGWINSRVCCTETWTQSAPPNHCGPGDACRKASLRQVP